MIFTSTEQFLMVVLAGLTTVFSASALYVLYKKGMVFQFHIGLFTFATSFMYHLLDSLSVRSFYLTRRNWLALDNIGSIMCLIALLIYLMDTSGTRRRDSLNMTPTDLHLAMTGLIVTLVLQEHQPWLLYNLVMPVLPFLLLLAGKLLIYGPGRFNTYYLGRGTVLLVLAVLCLVKGFENKIDHLRLWHRLWHCFLGLSSFYMWQAVDNEDDLIAEPAKKFELSQVFTALSPLWLRHSKFG